jgi:hypothetical protein
MQARLLLREPASLGGAGGHDPSFSGFGAIQTAARIEIS